MAIFSCSVSTANFPSSAYPLMMQRLHTSCLDAVWSEMAAAPLHCDSALLTTWASRSCLVTHQDTQAFPHRWEPHSLKTIQKGRACVPLSTPFVDPVMFFVRIIQADLAFPFTRR